jgi:hypothetical protein
MAYTNIDDPSAYFQTTLYTGTGSSQSITNNGNSDMQPDLWWQINRDLARGTYVADSSRGVTKYLTTFTTNADSTVSTYVTSFDSDGFTLGNGDTAVNNNAQRFVTWNWKANGGTTSTDTTSSITSTVQVNSDAGFSIVTYTGNGNTLGGFGHGLGVAPKVVFVKRRNAAADWCVYHKDMGAAYFMKLNTNDAKASGTWQDLDPSSTTVVVYSGGLVNGNGDDYVAYCFAEKQGYSKFGKYVGNGNANGTFVYTGFKPAWVMTKEVNAAGSWVIYDNKRDAFNPETKLLSAEASSAESTFTQYDFVSNGFKFRTSGSENSSGNTHIYMAFAENPFVTSTGIPTTAR